MFGSRPQLLQSGILALENPSIISLGSLALAMTKAMEARALVVLRAWRKKGAARAAPGQNQRL